MAGKSKQRWSNAGMQSHQRKRVRRNKGRIKEE